MTRNPKPLDLGCIHEPNTFVLLLDEPLMINIKLITLALAGAAQAQIGRTPAECEQNYGSAEPMHPNDLIILPMVFSPGSNPGPHIRIVTIFLSYFIDDKVSRIYYTGGGDHPFKLYVEEARVLTALLHSRSGGLGYAYHKQRTDRDDLDWQRRWSGTQLI